MDEVEASILPLLPLRFPLPPPLPLPLPLPPLLPSETPCRPVAPVGTGSKTSQGRSAMEGGSLAPAPAGTAGTHGTLLSVRTQEATETWITFAPGWPGGR